jgi:hypothetical protein
MQDEKKSSGCGKAFGFLVALVGLLAGSIAVYQFVFPPATPPPPAPTSTPTPQLSFLEQIEGEYTLSSWVEANRPIELAAKVTDGTMKIDSTGTADWVVMVEQTFTSNPGKVRMTARGKVQLATKQMEGVPGGEFNNTHYLDAQWGQVSSDVNLAVRGWDTGSPNDYFTLSLDTQSGGRQILEMKNSRGTFTWVKQ